MASTFIELKKKCREYGLKPCSGKGVDKKFLEKLLEEYHNQKPNKSEPREEVTPKIKHVLNDEIEEHLNDEIEEHLNDEIEEHLNDEKIVREHNPSLYESIREHILSMPDFRPEETMKMMKKEPQNNWSVIRHELESLSYNRQHMALVDAINSGELKEILPYINDRKFSSEFTFSYPGLVWLMKMGSPKETAYPFLISQGLYLKDIPITSELLDYIRDSKTAKKLYKDYSHLMLINQHSLLLWVQGDHIGWIYLALQNKYINPTAENNLALRHAIQERQHLILEALLRDPRVNGNIEYSLFKKAIEMNDTEMVRIIMENATIDPTANYNEPLSIAIKNKNSEIVKILLNYSNINLNQGDVLFNASIYFKLDIFTLLVNHPSVTNKKLGKLIMQAAGDGLSRKLNILLDASKNEDINLNTIDNVGSAEVMDILLANSRFDITINASKFIKQSIIAKDINLLRVILNDERSHSFVTYGLVSHAIKKHLHEHVEVLLLYVRMTPLINMKIIREVISQGHYYITKVILESPKIDISANNNEAIYLASLHNHSSIVKLLMEHPDVDPSDDNNRALSVAAEKGYIDVVKILMQDSRVDKELGIIEARKHGKKTIIHILQGR